MYLKRYGKGGWVTFDVLASNHIATGQGPPSAAEEQEKSLQEYGWGSSWLRWVH